MGTRRSRGSTLVEVIFAIVIVVVVFAGVILAYTQASYRAQWTGYSLAAESLAIKQIEQARSARWDPADSERAEAGNLFAQLAKLEPHRASADRLYLDQS